MADVTTPGGPKFVPPVERVAVFDNDGTLWGEQPAYFQVAFTLDRVKALAPAHPEWKDLEPFRSVLAGDLKAALAGGEKALLEVVAATHAGMTTDEFAAVVRDWIATAQHPTIDRRYTECVYAPMLELLAYLRAHGFTTCIVSGGGVEFMRPWAEAVYGIPPQQVIGSRIRVRHEVRDGKPVLARLPEVDFIDDKAGKPWGSSTRSAAVRSPPSATPTATSRCSRGRRPARAPASACSSITRTPTGSGPTTARPLSARQGARRRVGRRWVVVDMKAAWTPLPANGWVVVDMKRDWEQVFPAR